MLNERAFTAFLETKIRDLGTAACPPYTISVVVGGISPEQNLLGLKLATAGFFDSLLPGESPQVMGALPLRCPEWEEKVMDIAAQSGLGAQFGGTALGISACVLRLPRHGASCPVSVGVSCSAPRNLRGFINQEGIFLESTELHPEGLVEEALGSGNPGKGLEDALRIDFDQGMAAARLRLSNLSPGTPLLLSGKVLVARDAAHARWKERLDRGESLPEYTLSYPILYAGPAETPPGKVIGSFGPTTAGRMDAYAEDLMSRGAALITLAKGNRSEAWSRACARWGATYLGTVGGAAALIAEKHILDSQLLDYPELGMEAVRLVTLTDMPAFVLVNDRGDDFYRSILEAT